MNDALGTRMKTQYERRCMYALPRRTYVICRIDGRAFHSYCRGLKRPYDTYLMQDMDTTARDLCSEIQGAQLGYVQSDEISILLTDFGKLDTEAWFNSEIQKMVSVAASIATATFNHLRWDEESQKLAHFDARVFTIPDPWEVVNYFRWRQQDCVRNSISMTASTYFPHQQLQGLGGDQLQELLFHEAHVNWSQLPAGFKNGRWVVRRTTTEDVHYRRKDGTEGVATGVQRRRWIAEPAPRFGGDDTPLFAQIPLMDQPVKLDSETNETAPYAEEGATHERHRL